MHRAKSLCFAGLALAMLVPAHAIAQAPPPGMPPLPPGMPPAVQAKMMRFQQLEMQLSALRDKAMEDKKIDAKRKAVEAAIDAAIIKADPSKKEALARFKALKKKFDAAQAKKDQAAAEKLVPELSSLAKGLVTAQRAAMRSPEIMKRAETFEKALVARMKKIDPKAEALLNELEGLTKEIRAMLSKGPPPASPMMSMPPPGK